MPLRTCLDVAARSKVGARRLRRGAQARGGRPLRDPGVDGPSARRALPTEATLGAAEGPRQRGRGDQGRGAATGLGVATAGVTRTGTRGARKASGVCASPGLLGGNRHLNCCEKGRKGATRPRERGRILWTRVEVMGGQQEDAEPRGTSPARRPAIEARKGPRVLGRPRGPNEDPFSRIAPASARVSARPASHACAAPQE